MAWQQQVECRVSVGVCGRIASGGPTAHIVKLVPIYLPRPNSNSYRLHSKPHQRVEFWNLVAMLVGHYH